MKLLKKLLPLAIVGTTATAITPFVASCGNKDQYSASWNYRDGIFVYTTGKHAKAQLSSTDYNKEATKMYFEAVEDNPLILAEDVAQKMSYYQRVSPDETLIPMIPLTAKATVEDAHYDGSANDGDGACFITFTVDFTGIMGIDYDGEIIFDTYGEGHLEVQNVAFALTYRETESAEYENHWDADPLGLDLTDPDLSLQEEWSVVLDMTMPEVGRTRYSIFTSEDTDAWQLIGLAFASSVSPDYCYYLNDVSHA